MLIPLGSFLDSNVGKLVTKGLSSIGIGIISYGAVTLALEAFLTLAEGHYNDLPSFALNMLGLLGIGESLGMIAAALAFRVSMNATSKMGVLPK
jgi:hypothetical protein